MRKIALTLAAAVSAASLSASGMNPLAGLTIGVHGGYSALDTKFDGKDPDGVQTMGDIGSLDVSGRGGAGAINLGYTHIFANKMAIGVEAFGSLSSVKGNVSFVDANGPVGARIALSQKAKNSLGIRFRIGREFSGYMPYFAVGYVNTSFENTFRQDANFTERKATNRFGGLDLGLGVDCAVTDRVSLGAEFSHQEYQSKSFTVKNVGGVNWQNIKVKPRSNQLMLRLRVRTF